MAHDARTASAGVASGAPSRPNTTRRPESSSTATTHIGRAGQVSPYSASSGAAMWPSARGRPGARRRPASRAGPPTAPARPGQPGRRRHLARPGRRGARPRPGGPSSAAATTAAPAGDSGSRRARRARSAAGMPARSSAATIDPADVPTIRSARPASQPSSWSSAASTPAWKAWPTVPPAPSTTAMRGDGHRPRQSAPDAARRLRHRRRARLAGRRSHHDDEHRPGTTAPRLRGRRSSPTRACWPTRAEAFRDVLGRVPGRPRAHRRRAPRHRSAGPAGPRRSRPRSTRSTAADVVVVPGGLGTHRHPEIARWLLRLQPRWVLTSSTGSALLAASGLLRGRTAATHWLAGPLLERTASPSPTSAARRRPARTSRAPAWPARSTPRSSSPEQSVARRWSATIRQQLTDARRHPSRSSRRGRSRPPAASGPARPRARAPAIVEVELERPRRPA